MLKGHSMKPKELIFRYGTGNFDAALGFKKSLPVVVFFCALAALIRALDDDSDALIFTIIIGVIASLAAFVIRGAVKGLIIIGRRFIIVRQEIFYYRNLTKVKVEADKGTITLIKKSYPACVIKVGDFPTNARHEPKITNNRRNKFEKVKTKLLARMQAAAPELFV